MDYHRIYREFIADRKNKPVPIGYTERHHILPKSFGGSDDAENLIDLTADDHFFAHLLLAKAHGGKMGSALFLLVTAAKENWRNRYRARRAYGLARRIAVQGLSENWSGDRNPLFNATVIDWANYRTGELRSATLHGMFREFGGTRPHWTNVMRGDRPSYKGWVLAENLDGHSRSEKGFSFDFVNRDGRRFYGTQGDFAKRFGVNLATASRIVRHQSVTRCGWRLSGVKDRPANWAKDGLPSRQRRPQGGSETATG